MPFHAGNSLLDAFAAMFPSLYCAASLQGHNCTDYAKWFRADQPYAVEYHDGYEPWFIIDRFRNPWYDVSFRGYGWNKVSHVINIYYQK